MNDKEREQIGRALRNIAAAHVETMQLMEQTCKALSKELLIDPVSFWMSRGVSSQPRTISSPAIDRAMLSVVFHGRHCFLGNTLPFKLLDRLAHRPNAYVPYKELLSEIWECPRSYSAVRSVETLRRKLRTAHMGELADSIDGSVPRHYALKLDV
jgi:DNA-binding response OmpR family regulator